MAELPNSPAGLGDGWTQDHGHRNPNGEKWDHDSGTSVEWHPGQPGKPGWRGKDHWHVDGGKEHLPPGTDVPGFPGDEADDSGGSSEESSMSCGDTCQKNWAYVFIAGMGYVLMELCF